MLTSKSKVFILSGLFFASVTLIIIISWFRYGYLYGGGDVGLPSYDPQRILQVTKSIWWEAFATGIPVPNSMTVVPFHFFQSLLQSGGLSYLKIQIIFFSLILFFMGYGMFLVGLDFFGKNKYKQAILAGLFYMFNPYMMIQVWHRFIHNTFFLAAALPFFFITFRFWIKSGKYFWLLIFLLINLIAVYLYGTIAFIVTILTLLLFISLVESVFPWKDKAYLKKVIFRTVLGIIAWLTFNGWWLLPVINVSPAILSSQHSISENLATLIGLSPQTVIPYSLIGINPFYLYQEADFGKIYDTYFFRFLLWFPLAFLVPGFIICLKNKKFVLWALMAVMAIFLAKGATSPFGYPYIFGFNIFFPLGVLRNPFEKMGIFIPFSFAIIFSLGVNWYLEKKKGSLFLKAIVAVPIFLIIVVANWPMWLGNTFGKLEKPPFIKVPASYLQADKYIHDQKKTGRILQLPLSTSESVTYTWDHGYTGVEPSQLLFKSLPSISHGFNLGTLDDSLQALSYIFIQPNAKDKILNLLQAFNVKFIILHKDTEWRGGFLIDPEKLEFILDKLAFLEKKSKFGDLVVYELKEEFFTPKIKLSNNFLFFLSSKNNIYWPWFLSKGNEDIISEIDASLAPSSKNQIAISAGYVFEYTPEKAARENIIGEMPAANFLPDSPLYFFTKLKEQLLLFTLPSIDSSKLKVIIAGKRLVESYNIKKKNPSFPITSSINEYKKLLSEIEGEIEPHNKADKEGKEITYNFVFSRHLATLNLIREKASDKEKLLIDAATEQLANILKKTSTIPYNHLISEDNLSTTKRLISRFTIPYQDNFELLQATEESQDIYDNKLSSNTFQVNDSIRSLKGTLSGKFISYGYINLPKGINEISFNPIPSKNLVKFPQNLGKGNIKQDGDGIELISDKHQESYFELNLDPVKGFNEYQLSFESWIKLGDKFRIQIFQDTDPFDPKRPGEKLPFYDNNYPQDPYINYWIGNTFNFFVKPTTTSVTIRFLVEPWNGCNIFQAIKSLCFDKKIRYPYERLSDILFKNIKVVRFLKSPLFLRSDSATASGKNFVGSINFTQESETSYSGNINLTSPGFFIFNETYHPGWELKLSNNKERTIIKRYLSNSYGNAWYLDKEGIYNFKLVFNPRNNVRNGLIISIVCGLTILLLVSKQGNRK